MRLPDFEIHYPKYIEDACLLLEKLPNAKILAGGTDLLVNLREERETASHLVSLRNIPGLREIEFEENIGLKIGPIVTLNNIIESSIIKKYYFGIYEAASSMCAYQTRNQATLGGNICSAVPSADMPPILIAMEARVEITSKNQRNEILLAEFFTGPKKTILKKGEILTNIILPPLDIRNTGACYLKHELRGALALAVVGVGVVLTIDENRCRWVRIGLGAVAPTPVLALKAGEYLSKKELSEETIENAGRIAGEESLPISDIRGSEEYRREIVRVLTKRAIKKAMKRINA